MMKTPNHDSPRFLRPTLAAIPFLIGALVLLGWHHGIDGLKTIFPGYISMKVNTALGLMSFAAALMALDVRLGGNQKAKIIASFFCFCGSMLGVLTLTEYVAGVDLGIDEFLYRDLTSANPASPPGRLAPITAISFVFLGFAILVGPLSSKPKNKLSQLLFFIVTLFSFQALAEYVLGMQTAYGILAHSRIAIHTAVSFVAISVGFLSLTSSRGHMRIFLSTSPAGTLARRLVLALFFMPPFIKFAVQTGTAAGLFDADFGSLVRSVLSITFFVFLVLRSAEKIQLSELIQRRSETFLKNQDAEREKSRSRQLVFEAIRAGEERTRMIYNSTFDGILGFNHEATVSEWNPQAEKMFGWTREDVIGRCLISLFFPAAERGWRYEKFRSMCETRDFSAIDKPLEIEALTKSGRLVPIRMGVSHMRVGEELFFIASLHDISDQKKIQEELIKSRELALLSTRSKSEFLANMSHEIRTPMNGIIGMSSMLIDSPLGAEQRESARLIKRSAQSLLSIVNGILDHSKIEAGKLELEESGFLLESIPSDVVQILRTIVEEKHLRMTCEFLLHEPDLYVLGDSGRIRQILVNLVGNAVKFTDKGEVKIKLNTQALESNRVRIRFEVIDSGPGLTAEEIGRLFSPYAQTETGSKKGGTGLGLYISSQLLQIMGGRYGVVSEPRRGATFWFEVELTKSFPQVSMQKPDNVMDLFGHVLVVEDQVINQRVIASYLAKLGLTHDVAQNGAEALESLEYANYDLVLMDCRMPVLDGYETTLRIRRREREKNLARIPIIALSAEARLNDKSVSLENGMDDFLGKPIDAEALERTLMAWLPPEKRSFHVVNESTLKKLDGYSSGKGHLSVALTKEFSRPRGKL